MECHVCGRKAAWKITRIDENSDAPVLYYCDYHAAREGLNNELP